ncbi:glycosyltransferase [Fusobacterium varium]|uniref:glycosyltransferase n=1 Tax=Fusobacterium varium TaxID=856 RepID=UPI0032C0B21E
MYKEKISVVVTLYNRLEYARNMTLSLQNQTLTIDELIFADDGSKEDVADIIKDLISKCPFKIKCVYQEDIGFRLARSRNNGVRIANGEFLIFLDQDVIMPDDFIEKIYNARRKKRIVFSKGLLSSEWQKEKIQMEINQGRSFSEIYNIITLEEKNEIKKIMKKDILYRFLYKMKLRTRGAKIAGLIFALYKEDYIAINGFDDNYKGWGKEDDDFGNRFFKYGGETYPVLFENFPIHMYHPNADSKKDSLNEAYYQKRKKEISKENFKCSNGYENSIDKDKVKVKIIKE